MTPAELLENLLDCVQGVVQKIPGKWTNIKSINIKTCDSTALPIYNCLPSDQDLVKEEIIVEKEISKEE